MSESQFTDEMEGLEKKKSGIPFWVWGCGGGCLVMLILLIGIGGYLFNTISELQDPEMAWPAVAEYLPFDERPDMTIFGGPTFMGTYFFLSDEEADLACLIIAPPEDMNAETMEEMELFFDGEVQTGFMGFGEAEEINPIELTIQGIAFDALEMVQKPVTFPGMDEEVPEKTQVLLLNFSTSDELILVQLFSMKNEEISSEAVEQFFAPFNLGDR